MMALQQTATLKIRCLTVVVIRSMIRVHLDGYSLGYYDRFYSVLLVLYCSFHSPQGKECFCEAHEESEYGWTVWKRDTKNLKAVSFNRSFENRQAYFQLIMCSTHHFPFDSRFLYFPHSTYRQSRSECSIQVRHHTVYVMGFRPVILLEHVFGMFVLFS